MESKCDQNKQKHLLKIFERIQLFLKKYCFLNLKKLKNPENEGKTLFKYVSKQSQQELRWLFSLDKIQHSQKAAKFTQDNQIKLHKGKNSYSRHHSKISTPNTRENLRKVPIYIHAQMKQEQRLLKNIQVMQNCKGVVPLSLEEFGKNFEQQEESNEDEEYILRIRQRKYQRQQFKTRLAQEQYSKNGSAFKKKVMKETQVTNKKQKCNLCQHFIEVDVNLEQSEQVFSKFIPQKLHKQNKSSNKILTHTPQKQIIKKNSLINTARERQPLKMQDRQFVLKPLYQLKLASGVTTRQYQNKSLNIEQSNSNTSLTRKKLQLLKNNDKNPAKIKLNELLSLKKLGTMNHLAYCSSMKTMKDIKDTKENIQSNLSIESRQLPSQILSNQKKLIKIANSRIFEELIVEKAESETQDAFNYRSRIKMKKEGKVRFDNLI